jgi:hypothetical protein
MAGNPTRNVDVWRTLVKFVSDVAEIFQLHFLENQTFNGGWKKSVFAVLDNLGDFGTIKPFQEKFG